MSAHSTFPQLFLNLLRLLLMLEAECKKDDLFVKVKVTVKLCACYNGAP